MNNVVEMAANGNVRVRVRRSEKPDASQRNTATAHRSVPEHKANTRRKSAANKRRRSEAWWSERIFAWEYRIFAREFLSRSIRCRLKPAEWCVLDFIFDRTLQWGKEWETIRLRQFIGGSIPDADGFQAFCGTGLSERTVQRATVSLHNSGLIRVQDKPNGNGLQQYAVSRLPEIEQIPVITGDEIRYRANWPATTEIIEIRSQNIIKTIA